MNEKNRTWRQDQIKQFGDRLKWSRSRAGYVKASDALRVMEEEGIRTRTYYAHEGGQRVPDDDETINMYATKFKVSREFLLWGNGTEREEYLQGQGIDESGEINQRSEAFKISPSQSAPVRYIPILPASEVRNFVLGQWEPTDMSGDYLPVPQHSLAGPRSFTFQLPADDRSMVGGGQNSFLPLTYLGIDPDRVTMPDEFLLVQPANWPRPILRQLHSAFPYMPTEPRFSLTLRALNPAFQPIQVENDGDCLIFGRCVFAHQAL